MDSDRQDARRRQIETAAFEVLAEKGYRSTSMLQIAKRAAASNQTLYAWYGSKQALFAALIADNGRAVSDHLRAARDGQTDPLAALEDLGPLLLAFTTGDKAILVNRAAIADADETGRLAEAIDTAARQEMVALITDLMAQIVSAGRFADGTDAAEAAEVYISLLFGEVQMRQALGRQGPLDPAQIAARAARAFALTLRLFGDPPALTP